MSEEDANEVMKWDFFFLGGSKVAFFFPEGEMSPPSPLSFLKDFWPAAGGTMFWGRL